MIIDGSCRVDFHPLPAYQQHGVCPVRCIFSSVDYLACYFDVIPRAAVFHVKESPVYSNERIVFPCKLSGRLELHGISGDQNPFPVFPEVNFYKVDFLPAFEEVIKMALLPYDAFLDRCNRPFFLNYRNGITALTPCSRLTEKES